MTVNNKQIAHEGVILHSGSSSIYYNKQLIYYNETYVLWDSSRSVTLSRSLSRSVTRSRVLYHLNLFIIMTLCTYTVTISPLYLRESFVFLLSRRILDPVELWYSPSLSRSSETDNDRNDPTGGSPHSNPITHCCLLCLPWQTRPKNRSSGRGDIGVPTRTSTPSLSVRLSCSCPFFQDKTVSLLDRKERTQRSWDRKTRSTWMQNFYFYPSTRLREQSYVNSMRNRFRL